MESDFISSPIFDTEDYQRSLALSVTPQQLFPGAEVKHLRRYISSLHITLDMLQRKNQLLERTNQDLQLGITKQDGTSSSSHFENLKLKEENRNLCKTFNQELERLTLEISETSTLLQMKNRREAEWKEKFELCSKENLQLQTKLSQTEEQLQTQTVKISQLLQEHKDMKEKMEGSLVDRKHIKSAKENLEQENRQLKMKIDQQEVIIQQMRRNTEQTDLMTDMFGVQQNERHEKEIRRLKDIYKEEIKSLTNRYEKEMQQLRESLQLQSQTEQEVLINSMKSQLKEKDEFMSKVEFLKDVEVKYFKLMDEKKALFDRIQVLEHHLENYEQESLQVNKLMLQDKDELNYYKELTSELQFKLFENIQAIAKHDKSMNHILHKYEKLKQENASLQEVTKRLTLIKGSDSSVTDAFLTEEISRLYEALKLKDKKIKKLEKYISEVEQ